MKHFPLDLLRARHAVISGEPGDASIEVLLRPFLWNDQLIDTSIRLDGIDLPTVILGQLVDKTFQFPLNPNEGAIDGTIYLENRHHPVDVSRITFNRSRQDGATVVIKGTYVFEFEGLGDYDNTSFTFGVSVSSCAV